jgi:hypothetical protein
MARETALVVCPGRGVYNKDELGYLRRHHADKADLVAPMDAARRAAGQTPVSELDGAERYSVATHTRGDNASALIHACAVADFKSIDRDRYEIVAVTGNSMGWYIALACGGALDSMGGFTVVNTMGTLMQEALDRRADDLSVRGRGLAGGPGAEGDAVGPRRPNSGLVPVDRARRHAGSRRKRGGPRRRRSAPAAASQGAIRCGWRTTPPSTRRFRRRSRRRAGRPCPRNCSGRRPCL